MPEWEKRCIRVISSSWKILEILSRTTSLSTARTSIVISDLAYSTILPRLLDLHFCVKIIFLVKNVLFFLRSLGLRARRSVFWWKTTQQGLGVFKKLRNAKWALLFCIARRNIFCSRIFFVLHYANLSHA